jgi:CheY-like chemotaxis protein
MKKIWIVDDDEEMTHAVSLMIKLLECDATIYYNARSASQALLAGKRPDLMILDINMPEVTGLDMLEFLRRRPEWKDLPVVMLSSETTDVMIDKAYSLGADGYVTKPVVIEELEHAINQAFEKYGTV